jgi:hypothetical protein
MSVQDKKVQLSDGTRIRLGQLWEHQPLILVFLRHYG